MHFFIAKDLDDIARNFDLKAAQMRLEANGTKSQDRIRKTGEAYGYEQAARILREVKWAADVERLGFDAPFAIPRGQPSENQADTKAVGGLSEAGWMEWIAWARQHRPAGR
jgi:hypothetical protein